MEWNEDSVTYGESERERQRQALGKGRLKIHNIVMKLDAWHGGVAEGELPQINHGRAGEVRP